MKIAFITIGQSPREDVMGELKSFLNGVEYFELGALDGLTPSEIEELKPRAGEIEYVTRLVTGEEVKVSKERIERRLQEIVDKISDTADLIVILCTGDFNLNSPKPIIYPGNLLKAIVSSLSPKKLGVIVPSINQIEYAVERWKKYCADLKVVAWSPYEGGREADLSSLLDRDLVVLDCIGYTLNHKAFVRESVNKPVILPRSLLGLFIEELS